MACLKFLETDIHLKQPVGLELSLALSRFTK